MLNQQIFFRKCTAFVIVGFTIALGGFLFSSVLAQDIGDATSTWEDPDSGMVLLGEAETSCTDDLFEFYNTGDDNEGAFQDIYWKAQTFTATTSFEISCVRVKIRTDGNADTLFASLRNVDEVGMPTSTDLTSGSADVSDLGVSSEWKACFETPYTLSADTKYALVIHASTTDDTWWRYDDADASYASGSCYGSGDSGNSWTSIYSGSDFLFETYGVEETPSVSPTSTASDINTPETYPQIFFFMTLLFLIGFYIVVKV